MNILHQNKLKTRLNNSSYDRNNKQTIKNINYSDPETLHPLDKGDTLLSLTPDKVNTDSADTNPNNVIFNQKG